MFKGLQFSVQNTLLNWQKMYNSNKINQGLNMYTEIPKLKTKDLLLIYNCILLLKKSGGDNEQWSNLNVNYLI